MGDDLFWPGADRAGDVFSEDSLVRAMVEVEGVWLGWLARSGVADLGPADAFGDLDPADPTVREQLATATEDAGNPAGPLVTLLREHPDTTPAVARWLHRGLTSQDVLDTALVLLAADAVAEVRRGLDAQVEVLAHLAREHRDTPTVARTLGRPAVPTTFGLVVATWLTGLLDARDDLVRLRFPVQLSGAAGTMAAAVELGLDPAASRAHLAEQLELEAAPPWHTSRAPVTRIGDALVGATDAWGRLANDVLMLSRPEVGELRLRGGGGSSTMPGKENPVLAVLVRRAALAAPPLAATLHTAAASQVDQRADGAWHVEWDTLRVLARRTVVAGEHVSELLDRLAPNVDAMAAHLGAADVLGEQRTMAGLAGHDPAPTYLGEAAALVDAVLARATG